MKFSEAMELLQKGAKVTRQPWEHNVYFLMAGEEVKSFQPKLLPYHYDEDIMVSDGWLVEGRKDKFRFYDIIPMLQQGLKAKLESWIDMYIYLDKSTKSLVVHSMDVMPFIPDFESFVAQDWIELK